MRIIEPHKFSTAPKQHKLPRRQRNKKTLLFGLIGTSLFSLCLYLYVKPNTVKNTQANVISINQITEEIPEAEKTGPRKFSGNEFRLLFDNLLQPNTERVELSPTITGDDIADARIRKIAESRGYKLRRSPVSALVDVDGYPLQEPTKQPWEDLKTAAQIDDKIMNIVSGYRSVKDQRDLFMSKLSEAGVKIPQIVAGSADEEINKILITAAIPGYSKHHTGYVFDLLCEGWAFVKFGNSNCHEWLSNNNYENAKKFGFIPSYPVDADLQGPNPEAWEYIYIGTEILNH